MKKCLLLFYWACTVCMLYAQDKNTSSFLFDDFQEAVVYFKNGSQFREKMNYNILANKFYFVDRVDNKVKALSNPQDIQVIKFGNRVFYTEGNNGIEILPTNPVLYVQYKGNMRKEDSKGAFGQPTETTSVKTYGGTYAGHGERYDFDPEKLILGSRYNIYWIEQKGKKKPFKNFNQFLKLYPKQKEELKRFIKENNVDFNNVQQISILCMHAESIYNITD